MKDGTLTICFPTLDKILVTLSRAFEGIKVCDDVPNMPLLDQDTGVVDALSKAQLVDTGLQTTAQEVLELQSQHVIELHARLVKYTNSDKTTNQSIAFEKTLGVFFVESKQLTVKTRHQQPERVAWGLWDSFTAQHDEFSKA